MPEKNNLHIIIAEDDIDDADVITETFTKNPHFSKVSLVANGEELLNYLKNTSNESPDVIQQLLPSASLQQKIKRYIS